MSSQDPNVVELEKELGRVEVAGQEPGGEGASRWANRNFRLGIGGAAAVLALLAVTLLVHYHGQVSSDDAQVDGHIVPIACKIYGTVGEVLILDNQAVKAGQVLVRIDPRDYQSRVDQAQAGLELAEAQARAAGVGVPLSRETTDSGTSGADAQLAAAQANYDKAKFSYDKDSQSELAYASARVASQQANNDRAQADLARMKPLMEKAEISQQQYDAYLAAARMAESELNAAKDKLASAKENAEVSRQSMLAAKSQVDQARAAVQLASANHKQVSIHEADQASAEAMVAKARADLQAAQLQLSYTTIVAPIDGVVTHKSVEVGQIVQPGQGLFTIIPLQDIWVTANFKETQLANVRPGQKAEIDVDMYGQTFTGHVDSIAGATGSRLSLLPPENATGNYVKVVQRIPVKILLDPIPPEKAILRPGMDVEATIITK
jgi:membrane fusion protein (multidrug efflux system)